MRKRAENNQGGTVNQITEGVIWKQLLIFFFPILFGTFFQQLYNTADAMIVGHFVGKQALAAVGGATGNLINLLVGFFVGISSGATVIISQYYGGKRADRVEKAVHTSIAFSIAGGIVLTVVGILTSRWLLGLMKTPEDVMDYALIYINIFYAGTIGNLLYNMGSGILRAIGDSRRPLYYLIICCLANIALDLLLVAVLDLGVLGAALATVLSQLLSAVLVIWALMRTEDMYHLEIGKIRMEREMLMRIVRIGLPTGMQSVMYSLSNVIIQTGVNLLGTDSVAAWAAFSKVDGLFWMMINALGISVATFVGQNYGAARRDRVHKGVRVGMVLALAMTGIMCAVLWTGGGLLMDMFTSDAEVRRLGNQLLRFMVPSFFTYIAIEVFSSALRGVGDCWIPMFITGIGICGMRVVWILLALPKIPTLIGAAACYPISWVITSVVFAVYYCFFGELCRKKEAARQTGK